MRNRFLAFLAAGAFAIAVLFGTAHSAWASSGAAEAAESAQVGVPSWHFDRDPDAGRIENVGYCSYLEASRETSIVSPADGSVEAVRLTNTAGTQTKAHSFNLAFDREYTLGEIRFQKVEFDYYHAQKRQQAGKGFPKLQLMYGNATKGAVQGGGETINGKSPLIATELDGGWWHLEYFITAMAPTMADHGDTPVGLSTKINAIRITDEYIYDHDSITAFIVVDNVRISEEPCSRLGLFNRTSSFAAGGYYWVKVAWAGELRSCVMTFSDPTVAEQDLASTKSPFYIKGLKAGSVVITATLTIGDGQVLSITTNTVSVT